MIKLITFDLDGTLAELGEGIKAENLALLHELENRGIRIALCSGKPTYYLCGFLRQVGLKRPVLAGENGSVIQIGIDLPPKNFYIQPYSEEAKKSLKFMTEELDRILPGMWYQPNLVGVSSFPKKEEDFDVIQNFVDENSDKIIDVDIYRHVDCYDFMPKGLSKKLGIEYMCKLLGIKIEETVCVGDGVNDYPMFECAGLSLGIQIPDEDKVDINFSCIHDALLYLLDRTEERYVVNSKSKSE